MTTGSKLLRALKARYKHPRDVLTRLGLDASLLNDPELRSSERGGYFDPRGPRGGGEIVRHEAGDDMNQMSAEEVVDKYGSFDIAPLHSGSSVPDRVESMPEQNVGDRRRGARDYVEPLHSPGQVDKVESEPRGLNLADDDGFEPFRQHLREHSDMSEDEIEEACGLARDHIRKRGANGRDKNFGRDRLPQNALHGGMGGHLSTTAMDSRTLRRLDFGLSRIVVEPEPRDLSRNNRRRHALDAAPPTQSARQREKMFKMFPHLQRVGSSMTAGPTQDDGHRNPYEV